MSETTPLSSPQPSPSASRLWLRWLPLLLLAAVMPIANVAVLPLTEVFSPNDPGAGVVYVSFGIILAEAGVLTAGLVFGPGPFWARFLIHWLVAGVLFAHWAIGWNWAGGFVFQPQRDLPLILLSLPLVSLGVQLPLWLVRTFWGWRLAAMPGDTPVAADPPLAIRDLMLATVVVAISLGGARWGAKFNPTLSEYWMLWGIAVASLVGVSLISILPAAWLVLRWPGGWIGAGLLLAYGLLAGIITLGVIAIIEPMSRRDLWQLFGFLLVFVGLAGTLAAGGLAARKIGYRLVIGRSSGR